MTKFSQTLLLIFMKSAAILDLTGDDTDADSKFHCALIITRSDTEDEEEISRPHTPLASFPEQQAAQAAEKCRKQVHTK